MQLCISSLAWDNKDRQSVYSLLQKMNVRLIEVVLSKLSPRALEEDIAFYKQCQAEWESFGLKAVSIQSIHFGVQDACLFGTELQRENLLNATKKALDIAHALEIPNLVFGSPKLRIIPSGGSASAAGDFFDSLNNYAMEGGKNCFINIEANSTQYGTNFLTTTKEAFDYIQSKAMWCHNCIGLNLDLGTMILENEDIAQTVDTIGFIRHAHISLPFLKTNFSDHIPQIKDYITSLKKANELKPVHLSKDGKGCIAASRASCDVSIEMNCQETDLPLIGSVISLIQEIL